MDTAQTNLFYRISQYRFMCVELNLYLDTHPNDENARADYQCYARRLLQLIEQYESEYGLLLKSFARAEAFAVLLNGKTDACKAGFGLRVKRAANLAGAYRSRGYNAAAAFGRIGRGGGHG